MMYMSESELDRARPLKGVRHMLLDAMPHLPLPQVLSNAVPYPFQQRPVPVSVRPATQNGAGGGMVPARLPARVVLRPFR